MAFETIEELQAELKLVKEAKADIIAGRVITFGKGDTRYRFMTTDSLNEEIRSIKTRIALKESSYDIC